VQEIIHENNWVSHPFLSRLTRRSDLDGDAALTVVNPTQEDFAYALRVTLERRIGEGEWAQAAFSESTAFIDEVSMAWYYSFMYHPLFELDAESKGKQVHEWRAVVTD
jgi:hypothetical protein